MSWPPTYTPSALICVASPCAFEVGTTVLVAVTLFVTVFVTVTVGAAWVTVTVGPGWVAVFAEVPLAAALAMPATTNRPMTPASTVSTLWRTGHDFPGPGLPGGR